MTTSTVTPQSHRSATRSKHARTLIYQAAVILIGVVMIYPLLWLFASSFKGPSDIWTHITSLIPREFTLSNYSNGWAGFGGVSFAVFFQNSFIYAILGTITVVLSSAVVAYGFARIRFFGRGILFACTTSC